jgi:hypothetical protein
LGGIVCTSAGGKGKFPVAQRHDFGAKIVGHHVQDVVELHDAEVLQDSDHGRAGALDFGNDLFVLQVVNQILLFDERQQWTGNFFGHGKRQVFDLDPASEPVAWASSNSCSFC